MAEWISVKDRLPEDKQEVIVSIKMFNGGLLREQRTVISTYSERFGFEFYLLGKESFFVDYWMPLPEPPKGEGQ